MELTQELLTKWTGLDGLDLTLFYLEYKKQSSNTLPPTNLHQLKEDILEFKKCTNKNNKDSPNPPFVNIEGESLSIFPPIKRLIHFWESYTMNKT